MGVPVLPSTILPLQADRPITQQGHLADPNVILTINSLIANFQSVQAQVQALLPQVTAAQQVQATQAAQIATAQQTADAGTPTGAQSGQAAALVTAENFVWSPGPQVDLTGVSAGILTLSMTLTGPASISGGSITSGNGIATVTAVARYRIQEIVSGVEMTVFPVSGVAEVTAAGSYSFAGAYYVIGNNNQADLQAFSSSRASTGAVSYRLDFRCSTSDTAINDINATLVARRA